MIIRHDPYVVRTLDLDNMEQSAETIQNAVLVWTLTVLKFIQHGIMQILNFFTFMFGNADGELNIFTAEL